MNKILKYPIYLFFAILLAKIGYIIIESYYNYYVLITTTSPDVNKETLENINKTGHHISASGITLLLIPIFYIFIKKLSEQKIYLFTTIFALIMYITSYNLLNTAIDHIVKVNKEERHDSYYVNIFKSGLLNEAFYYDNFIHRDKIKNSNITIEDRILLTNSFMLLYADENLIDKLKQKGQEALAQKYLNENESYQKNYKEFEKLSDEIISLWNELLNAKEQLTIEKNKVITLNSEDAYNTFKKELSKSYNNYLELWKKVSEKTTETNISDSYNQLNKYFRYKGNSRAEKQYTEQMTNQFGYFIEPTLWLDNGKLTHESVKKLITKEILKNAGEEFENIPKELSTSNFFNNSFTKIIIAKQLKAKGIFVTKDFDYSYDKFKYFYDKSISLQFQEVIDRFYKELENKIGTNDLKLNSTWIDFVNSEYLKNKISSKITFNDDIKLETILKVLESADLNNFKELIYMPKTLKEVKQRMFSREQFMTDEKAIDYGDNAIRLLYVPPFALAISILALLLNSITVIGMVLEYGNKFSTKKIFIVKIFIFLFIVLLPFITGYNGFDNELIQNIKNDEIVIYMQFLNWIGYYENFNSAIH